MLVYIVKISLFIYFTITPLFAYDSKTAAIIYEKIFKSFIDSEKINIYAESIDFSEVFKHSSLLHRVYSPLEADITVVTKDDEIIKDKTLILFATDIDLIKKSSNVIGAFYWDHGRPKIIFIRSRLKYYNLDIGYFFSKYIKDDF